jgi:hypothetical protein
MSQKIGPRELALRAQREAASKPSGKKPVKRRKPSGDRPSTVTLKQGRSEGGCK